jgi:hypothetical protein
MLPEVHQQVRAEAIHIWVETMQIFTWSLAKQRKKL